MGGAFIATGGDATAAQAAPAARHCVIYEVESVPEDHGPPEGPTSSGERDGSMLLASQERRSGQNPTRLSAPDWDGSTGGGLGFRSKDKELQEKLVTLQADTPLVDPSRTGSKLRVDGTQVEDLPISGRLVTDLALLDSSVVPAPAGYFFGERGSVLGVDGQSGRANSYLLDGAPYNDPDTMTVVLRATFLEAAHELPKGVARKVRKRLKLFIRDQRHSRLNVEKLTGSAAGLESLRVDNNFRVILSPGEPAPTLLFVGSHESAVRYAERAERPTLATVLAPEGAYVSLEASTDASIAVPATTVLNLLVRSSKYLPLTHFLITRPDGTTTAHLRFGEIEQMIGESLPPSARKHRAWWSNGRDRRVQAAAWLSVGWKVDTVNQPEEWVTFERYDAAGEPRAR